MLERYGRPIHIIDKKTALDLLSTNIPAEALLTINSIPYLEILRDTAKELHCLLQNSHSPALGDPYYNFYLAASQNRARDHAKLKYLWRVATELEQKIAKLQAQI